MGRRKKITTEDGEPAGYVNDAAFRTLPKFVPEPFFPFKAKAGYIDTRCARHRSVKYRNVKQLISCENKRVQELSGDDSRECDYVRLLAPPPEYPPRKYCDLTHFPANYTHRTGLYCASLLTFEIIQNISPDLIRMHLALRRAEKKFH